MKQTPPQSGKVQPTAEVEKRVSAVAPPPAKNILIIVIAILFSLFSLYQLFFKSDKSTKNEKELAPIDLSTISPVNKAEDTIINIAPPLPEPPPVVVPQVPIAVMPPAPAPTLALTPPPPSQIVNHNNKEDPLFPRKHSTMFIGGQKGAKSGAGEDGTKLSDKVEPYRGGNPYNYSTIAHTTFAQAKATDMGNIQYIIGQGKVIDAVLESAINSDYEGMIRAIVNHDVYAETGKTILVPKGSRLVGSYQANVKRGESRVNIIWDRIMRPDGIDINVSSPATDTLGRAGVEGLVDSKYLELFGNALLISTISTGFGFAAQKLSEKMNGKNNSGTMPGVITSTTLNNGTVQQSGNLSDLAAQQAITNFQNATQNISQDFLKVTPTIMVNQGTKVKVFLKRDLVFPDSIMQNIFKVP